jgi:hypothetical protein
VQLHTFFEISSRFLLLDGTAKDFAWFPRVEIVIIESLKLFWSVTIEPKTSIDFRTLLGVSFGGYMLIMLLSESEYRDIFVLTLDYNL